MRSNRWLAMVALALSGALLAACGDGDGGPQATATSAPPTVGGGPTSTTLSPATTTSSPRAATTSTTRAAVTLDCQTVGFTPNSEDAASSIKATGLSCAEAEAFVRIAGRQTSSGGPAQVDVGGYRCVRVRSLQEPLPQAFYECTNAAMKVTFVRS